MILVGTLIFYILTTGLANSLSSNIQVGRLSWLNSNRFLDALDAYIVPARSLAKVPGLAQPFQWSENLWRTITGAPICISYGTRLEPVMISDAPEDLVETFKRQFPLAEIQTVKKEFTGRKSNVFLFWVIRFRNEGKLREALMNTSRKVDMSYDVQEP